MTKILARVNLVVSRFMNSDKRARDQDSLKIHFKLSRDSSHYDRFSIGGPIPIKGWPVGSGGEFLLSRFYHGKKALLR
jgi:hypothetical protein